MHSASGEFRQKCCSLICGDVCAAINLFLPQNAPFYGARASLFDCDKFQAVLAGFNLSGDMNHDEKYALSFTH